MPATDEDILLIGRLRAGVAGEARRAAHLLVVPTRPGLSVTALCGETLRRQDIELLPEPTGMPCEPCMLQICEPRTGDRALSPGRVK